MSDEINPVALRLYKGIAQRSSADAAYKIAFGYQLPLVPTPAERQAWVGYAMRMLERSFTLSEIRAIRQGCHCSRGLAKTHRLLLGCLPGARTLEELGAALAAATEGEWSYEKTPSGGGHLVRRRTVCTCPMVEDLPPLAGGTWCRCAEGWCTSLFGQALGCAVRAELAASLKQGDGCCLVRLTPLGEPRLSGRGLL